MRRNAASFRSTDPSVTDVFSFDACECMTQSGPGMDILIAAFEPFGGRTRNRSLDVLHALAGSPVVRPVELPVDFRRLEQAIRELAAQRPPAVLLIGESPRPGVAVEQVALNVIDTDRPDNAGHAPQSQRIHADGPLALSAPWNANALLLSLRAEGIPAQTSHHAGTYACNAALYLALRLLPEGVPVGFMHVNKWRWPRGVRLSQLVRAGELCSAALIALAHNPAQTRDNTTNT